MTACYYLTAKHVNWYIPDMLVCATLFDMSKTKVQHDKAGSWVFREIPRDLMHKMKIAAAVQRKSVKQLLMELSAAHIEELEKKGLLPKGK